MLESIVSMFQDHDKMMLCLAATHTYIFNTPHIVFFKLAREAFFVSFLNFYQQTISVTFYLILFQLSIQIYR